MSRNKKTRKAYRPKPIAVDNMAVAKHHACKPSKQDRGEVLDLLGKALQALRQGVATEFDWSVAAGSVSVATAIENQGIVRGLREHIATTDRALQAIYDRAMRTGTWCRTALWFDEMDALANFLSIHRFQVDQLGRDELLAAIGDGRKKIIADGCTVAVLKNIDAERMAA